MSGGNGNGDGVIDKNYGHDCRISRSYFGRPSPASRLQTVDRRPQTAAKISCLAIWTFIGDWCICARYQLSVVVTT
jgi:hypothetical protein